MAKNTGMSFSDWWISKHNPLHDASGIAKDFARDACKDAFEAGRLYDRRLKADARRKLARMLHTDDFSFTENTP